MYLKTWVRMMFFLLIISALFAISPNLYKKSKSIYLNLTKQAATNSKNSSISQNEYKMCLNRMDNNAKVFENVESDINNLKEYIGQNYRASIKYKNLITGFEYEYNPDEIYYAASTIKLLDGLYIYDQLSNDLNTELTYTDNYVYSSSKGLQDYNIGDKIIIRKLVEYAIIYSDNSAHQMLINYIGKDNLKEYGKSLGANYTLYGEDNFGSINVDDAIKYLEATYKYIKKNQKLGSELKEYLLNAEENYIKYDGLDKQVIHKYGYYNEYFHDIGIVYDEQPYAIAILTTHGNESYKQIINEISQRINNIHKKYIAIKKFKCKKL